MVTRKQIHLQKGNTMETDHVIRNRKMYGAPLFWTLTFAALYAISRFNYPLFHSLVDTFTAFIAIGIFVMVWYSRRYVDNDYFLYLGIAFLFFAILNFFHVLGNKNMGVFPQYGNLGPALYIAGRYLLSLSLVVAPLFINRRLRAVPVVFAAYALVMALILLSFFYGQNFPVCYIEGVGLTPFKVVSDYVICLVLLGALALLLISRRSFDARMLRLLAVSIILSIATGLAFTLYADPFGVTNAFGHFFQILSFYLIYLAVIETGLTRPQAMLFRKLQETNRQLAEAVDKANKLADQAEMANRAKSVFLANMSHELRTPLTGILGYADILARRAGNNPAFADGLAIIRQSGEHLLTLINDVLDLSRIEAEKLELHPVPVQLSEFLRRITGIMRARAEAKHLALTYEELSPLPAGILTDETRLRQVLLNLLGNAVKFTDRGQVSLTVAVLDTAEPESGEPQATVRFAVEDTGIGLAPDQLERIFHPFEQIYAVDRQAEGAGLGLSISRQIVQHMGGRLQVKSPAFPSPPVGGTEGGPGSVFWFEATLPVTAVAGPEERPAPDRRITGYEGARRTVLVVDDKLYNRLVVRDLLEPLGFVVHTAEDGQQAVAQAVARRPDVILLDLVMPVKTGIEAAREIRQSPELHEVAIIAMSASVFEADQAQSLVAGCNAFLPKPINTAHLLDVLATYLKLNWIYTEPEVAAAARLVPPPAEELATLRKLARSGRVLDLENHAARLAEMDNVYRPFAEKLQQLARAIEIDQIVALLEQFSEEAQDERS